MTAVSGATPGATRTVVLASGKLFPDETAAQAAKANLGQLTSANVHANLQGTGKPVAVVGSSDGWIYGVDPCDATLKFSVDMGAPAGEVVFGDTDGDGKDELIVSVADGYLYGLKNAAVQTPQNVIDLDPDHGATSVDVDVTRSSTSLSGRWNAVPGAARYEVAVADSDGKMLTVPSWNDAGATTQATVSALTLDPAKKYYFGVRAVSAMGTSPDGVSDGVAYRPDSPDAGPDGGSVDAGPSDVGTDAAPDAPIDGGETAGGGCGCSVPRRSTQFGGIVALLAALCGAFSRVVRRHPRDGGDAGGGKGGSTPTRSPPDQARF
jgi:hypothetical protein